MYIEIVIWIEAIILSVVEGITEFLPISSTGHMTLVANLMRISQSEFVKSFEIVIQLGAIGAVAWLYRKRLTGSGAKTLWPKILVAFLPTGILGFTLYKAVKGYLIGNVTVTLLALALGGFAILYLEKVLKNKEGTVEKTGWKKMLIIGFFQSVSMIPGVSRAAATIIGGRVMGLSRREATEFSFFLAIPTMVAAAGFDLVKTRMEFSGGEYGLLAFGFVGAFVTALLTVKWFVSFVEKHNLSLFGWYRIGLAVVYWLVVR